MWGCTPEYWRRKERFHFICKCVHRKRGASQNKIDDEHQNVPEQNLRRIPNTQTRLLGLSRQRRLENGAKKRIKPTGTSTANSKRCFSTTAYRQRGVKFFFVLLVRRFRKKEQKKKWLPAKKGAQKQKHLRRKMLRAGNRVMRFPQPASRRLLRKTGI